MTLSSQVRECRECHHAYRATTLRDLYVVRVMLRLGFDEAGAKEWVQAMMEAELRDIRLMYGRAPRGTCPECLPIVSARLDASRYPEPA